MTMKKDIRRAVLVLYDSSVPFRKMVLMSDRSDELGIYFSHKGFSGELI